MDVTDPLVQVKIGREAYEDANRQIFMENNVIAKGLNSSLATLERADPVTGRPTATGKAAAMGVRFALPIVKIPMNIVKRSFEYSLGEVAATGRVGRAILNEAQLRDFKSNLGDIKGLINRSIERLSPEESDAIMRNLKRGALGKVFLALGFFMPDVVGGYYQAGQKRSPEDVELGGLRVGGVDIPRWMVHNPLLEQLQIGATIRRVADSKLRKKDVESQGYGAGIMAAYTGLIEEVPIVQQSLFWTKLFRHTPRTNPVPWRLANTANPGLVQWTARWLDVDKEGAEKVFHSPSDRV